MAKRCGICAPIKNFTFLLLASNILVTIFLAYLLTILWIYRNEYNEKIRSNEYKIAQNTSKIKFTSFQASSLFNYLQIFQDFYEIRNSTQQSSIQNLTSLWSYNSTYSISPESWETIKNISSVVESLSMFSPIYLSIQNNSYIVSTSSQTSNLTNKFSLYSQVTSQYPKFMTRVHLENSQLTQLACLNLSQILLCFINFPTYPTNVFISQNSSTIWHANLKSTILESEYPEQYFLSLSEKSEFSKKFFATSVTATSFKYQQKGEQK